MDSSDITKRRKQQAIYTDKQNAFLLANPAGDCANLSSCPCTRSTNCVRTFTSFEEKYAFYKGRNACVAGAGPVGDFAFGKEGCMIVPTGGAK